MQANPCPLEACSGRVFVRRFGGIKAFGCDGEEQHTDSQVRNAMLGEVGVWGSETRRSLDDLERRMDPVAWLLDRVEEAKHEQPEKIVDEDLSDFAQLPPYRTGFVGREVGALLHLRGMTTLSGKASSRKTWFALGAALLSARDGWDVHYVAAEADDVVKRRIHKAMGDREPDRFRLHSIQPWLRAIDILDRLSEWIVSTRTLLVVDSISTLMQFMRHDKHESRWDAQGRIETFLMALRRLTRGEVSLVVVSEANALGESKGRTIDHRSDVSINFKALDDSDASEVRVVKSWEGTTGLVGRARVNTAEPGLELVYEGPRAYEGDGNGF